MSEEDFQMLAKLHASSLYPRAVPFGWCMVFVNSAAEEEFYFKANIVAMSIMGVAMLAGIGALCYLWIKVAIQ